jgi:hypothetical protein
LQKESLINDLIKDPSTKDETDEELIMDLYSLNFEQFKKIMEYFS